MNSNTYQYWTKESLDYLVYLDSLKCFSDDFKEDIIKKAISDILSKRELKEDLDRHSVSQEIQELAMNEACKEILNNIGKWNVDYEVNGIVRYNLNNSDDESFRFKMNEKQLSDDITWMTLDEFEKSFPEHIRFIKAIKGDFDLNSNQHKWIIKKEITIENIIQLYPWIELQKLPGMWKIILGRILNLFNENSIEHNITPYK